MSNDATATSPAQAPAQTKPAANTEAAAPAAAAGNEKTTPAGTPAQSAPAPTTTSGSGASLYVGELDPSVTEAMLFEIFNMIGPVASIRVCRDAVTRRSLGYAYVNYISAADGERALDHLNYSLIKNLPCRIMWSQRDPALRKTGQGNIFIKNLDESIDNKALHDTFAAFGDILSCKVGLDDAGKSRGFAFVHYSTGEAASAAIKAVNGMLLNDKKVFVGAHVGKRERQGKIEEQRSHFTNIFVKNLEGEITDEEFEALFAPYGNIISAAIGRDEAGANKGFGFVNFTDHEDAKKACDELNDTEFKGKKIYVGRAQKRTERDEELKKAHQEKIMENDAKSAGVNLYCKNLDDEWDDDRLRSEFEPFGSITSCRVMRDEKGVSRNFGFVCYASPDEATKAVSEMNGKMIGTKPLYVALAQRKDVRRQALESQMANRSTQQYNVPPPYMGAPMYGYNGQPMMPMRPMYPGQQQMMMGGRGGPGGPGGRGMMPPQMGAYGMQMGGYPGMPQQMGGYPGMPPQQYGARPMRPPAPSGGPQINGRSPTGAPQGLPVARGQMPQRPQQGFQDQQQGQAQPGRLNAASLARAGQAEQKQMLGEVLYPLIHEGQPDLAGKITGMLLEMDNGELLHLVESPAALQEKVDEALRVLAEWGSKGENGEEVKEEEKEEKAE